MRKIDITVFFLLFISLRLTAEYDNKECDNIYCTEYEWYNNGGRFDPHTIEWPLHYTGETYKDYIDGGHHRIAISHKGHNSKYQYHTLDKYRRLPECPDPWYMKSGIKMPDPFECTHDVTDRPKWKDSKCSNVLAGYEDQVVSVDGPACSKILRHWTIIDWCKWKPNTVANTYKEKYDLVYDSYRNKSYFAYGRGYHDVEHDGYYTFTQVIKIVDKFKPELTDCDDIHYNVPAGKCEAIVKLRNKVIDTGPCPGDKMTIEFYVTDEDHKRVVNKWLYAKHDQSFDANLGYLKAGHYTVHWSYSDGCGNKNHCEQSLWVEDNNPPSLLCIKDLSTSISDEHGVSIWAKDFVHKLEGKCDAKDVTLSFQKNELEMSRHFDCDENLGIQLLTVYATDSKGNQASCNVELFISDHNFCSVDEMQVAGAVFDRNRKALSDVDVDVYQGASMVTTSASNQKGHYNLYGIPMEKSSIVLKAHKNDSSSDGLDQYDLLKLLRHITGVEKFNTVLQYAAADINSDAVIDLKDYWDLAAIIYSSTIRDVSHVPSWKFFDAHEYYGGQKIASKLVVPIPVRTFRHRYDIMGIKVGDIDFSIENPSTKSYKRNSELLTSNYTVTNSANGYKYTIAMPAQKEGYAMTLTLEGIQSSDIRGIQQGNRSLEYMTWMQDGVLMVSIASASVLTDENISLHIASAAQIRAEGAFTYQEDGALAEATLILAKAANVTSQLNVSPNPFADEFEINYDATEYGTADIQLISIDGRTQLQQKQAMNAGVNRIAVDAQTLASGIYLLRIQMNEEIKIVRVTKNQL